MSVYAFYNTSIFNPYRIENRTVSDQVSDTYRIGSGDTILTPSFLII